ncbi:hypothetical protein N0V83_009133 [Neocucurbitaria cava]|uniref:Uncharacterized protein n=1 Tax=Neocucurbitaria cava TaxID=798079 RepID=A0A9W8Y2T6_9PLEO|nr:hypothetical protein N0V83_009133 [Neocucurbitaria cava]
MANSQDDANHRCRVLIDNIFESLSTIVKSIPDSKDEEASIVKPLCALVEKAYHKVFQAYAATYLMIKDKDEVKKLEVKKLEESLQAAFDSLETYAESMKQYMLTPFRVWTSRLHNNRKSFELHFMACASRILPSKEYETLALFNASLHEEQPVRDSVLQPQLHADWYAQTFAVKTKKPELRSSVTSSSSNGSTSSAKSIDDMGYIDFKRTLSPEIMPIAPILQEGLGLTPAEKHINTAVKAFLLSQHRSLVKAIALEEKGSQVEKIVELDEPITPVRTEKVRR